MSQNKKPGFITEILQGKYRKMWFLLFGVSIVTFFILGYLGVEVYRQAPPIPKAYVSETKQVVMTERDILDGQKAWQGIGGMQVGTIWGHGAYQAPDWTADWLHRELMAWLNITAKAEHNKAYDELTSLEQELLKAKLKDEYRKDQAGNDEQVVLSDTRIAAIQETAAYYDKLFGNDPDLQGSRESFAMKENTLPTQDARAKMATFFFWTAWAAATERPGYEATYTNNWPHEPLIDNKPTTENIMWSIASVVFLLAGVGLVIWCYSFFRNHEEEVPENPVADPLLGIALTPSQRALWKYLFVVVALFVAQVFLGGFVAHYTVEGQEFYGIDVSQWFPYALVRTWHIQTALFWIATAFLSAGLFLAPIINGGKDPKYQLFGVNFLFIALLIVVVGSFAGNFFALSHAMPESLVFWFGIQGYEYIDLGRFWQILLYVGLLLWLALVLRVFKKPLTEPGDKNMAVMLASSILAVGLFYGPGFFYGQETHISVMEYWRWWVVHLWVEGYFEVFATAAIAFVFSSVGLVGKKTALAATIMSAALFLLGGVPGTFHHLYFSGTTTPVMAVGASFSALEVVPLIILGHEAWEHWKMKKQTPWAKTLTWPIYCFVAVAFWNMLGAGVFGFMINPPISLYYLQGLNTTAVHAHAALFGVYGFLALGFVLLVLRYIRPNVELNAKWMKVSFWSLNLGIVLMITTSLLPIGVFQAHAAMSEGLWYARSEGFMQQGFLETLRWIRTIGDVIFIIGAVGISAEVTKALLKKNA